MGNPVPVAHGPYRRRSGRKNEHGIRGFEERLRRGGRVDRRRLESRELETIEGWLAKDRGGWDAVNNGERLLIQITAFAYWVCLRVRRDAVQKGGVLDEQGELRPPLRKSFIAYARVAGQNHERLGIRPDPINQLPSLQEYLEQRDATAPPAAPASTEPAVEAETPVTVSDATEPTP